MLVQIHIKVLLFQFPITLPPPSPYDLFTLPWFTHTSDVAVIDFSCSSNCFLYWALVVVYNCLLYVVLMWFWCSRVWRRVHVVLISLIMLLTFPPIRGTASDSFDHVLLHYSGIIFHGTTMFFKVTCLPIGTASETVIL